MAKGDMICGYGAVTAGGTFDIKPSTGTHWIIHNIYWDFAAEFYTLDSLGVAVKWDSDSANNAQVRCSYHVSQSHFLRIKNTNTSAGNITYDGVEG